MRVAMGQHQSARICVRPTRWVFGAMGPSLLTALVVLLPGPRLAQATEARVPRALRGRAIELVRNRLVVPLVLVDKLGLSGGSHLLLSTALHARANQALARAKGEDAGSARGKLLTAQGIRLTNAGRAIEAVHAWSIAKLVSDMGDVRTRASDRVSNVLTKDHPARDNTLKLLLNGRLRASLSPVDMTFQVSAGPIVSSDGVRLPNPSAETQRGIASLQKRHALSDEALAYGTVISDVKLSLRPQSSVFDATGSGPGMLLSGGFSVSGGALGEGQRLHQHVSVYSQMRHHVE